jgi:phosphopantothenoylcysteine decarboxylase / phosphopantothenate---cysteine ligase
LLKGKNIAVGVTGSIAAYRAIDLCRFLIKQGAAVNVMMTPSAQRFIGPPTFAGLTGSPPLTDLFSGGFPHLTVAKEADLLVVAPATANIIAKLAAGIADCPVSLTALGAKCPVIVCPAMNDKLWSAAATRRNVGTLRALGYEIVGPVEGDLACGDTGQGRLSDNKSIEAAVVNRLNSAGQLRGKKVLVTAGPTREHLDPVRFLSNGSSGKTGYRIAEEAARRGAEVTLVSGPTALRALDRLDYVPVVAAADLQREVEVRFADVDAVIMTAAVADQRFASRSDRKLPKMELPPSPDLIENPDILRALSRVKTKQILVGFAAQTEDQADRGRTKLVAKGLDFIVSTRVGFNEGFGDDAIEASIVDSDSEQPLGLIEKRDLASAVIDKLAGILLERPNGH